MASLTQALTRSLTQPLAVSPDDFRDLVGASSYNPVTALGSDLIAYLDANRSDLITIATGVSQWADVVAGYTFIQATGSAQPAYSATSFNGKPGVAFDGIDDTLTSSDAALLSALPAGANASEIWVLLSQDAPSSDATARVAVTYGNTATTASRTLQRTVVSAVNRARAGTGDGAVQQIATDTVTDFSTRHVLRQQIGATQTALTVDGGTPITISAVPATTNTRARLASFTTSFYQGKIAAVLFTKPLSAAKASALQTYLLNRR